jgi:DNA-binding NarL/FixJ family response regulator
MSSLVVGDAHELTVLGVQSAVAPMHIDVVATVRRGLEVFPAVDQHEPDLLALGFPFPPLDGLNLLYSLSRRRPDVDVIVLASTGSRREARKSFERGALAYVQKQDGPDELRSAIETIQAGERFASESLVPEGHHEDCRGVHSLPVPSSEERN